MPPLPNSLRELLTRVIAPLVEADGGELYVVAYHPQELTLHLTGRFAGCPGSEAVRRHILAPAIKAVAPETRLIVTTGHRAPADAELLSHSP
jgi:Fe-S cluster biogenesis protein NfuA